MMGRWKDFAAPLLALAGALIAAAGHQWPTMGWALCSFILAVRLLAERSPHE